MFVHMAKTYAKQNNHMNSGNIVCRNESYQEGIINGAFWYYKNVLSWNPVTFVDTESFYKDLDPLYEHLHSPNHQQLYLGPINNLKIHLNKIVGTQKSPEKNT